MVEGVREDDANVREGTRGTGVTGDLLLGRADSRIHSNMVAPRYPFPPLSQSSPFFKLKLLDLQLKSC